MLQISSYVDISDHVEKILNMDYDELMRFYSNIVAGGVKKQMGGGIMNININDSDYKKGCGGDNNIQ